jgi:cytochrome c-type biogenesis protein
MGIFFSAGWSPCIGPILGAILTAILSNQVTQLQAVLYLLIYSLGMGLPFLGAALGLQPLFKKINRNSNLVRRIQQISGGLLAVFGVLLMLGLISRLAQITPRWLY